MQFSNLKILTIVFAFLFTSEVFADDYENENIHWANYIPVVITGPTSLVFTGAGYVVDGTVYFVGLAVVPFVICMPIILPVAAISRDGRLSGELFRACGEVVNTKIDPNNYLLGMGHGIYEHTKSWRKPFRIIITDEESLQQTQKLEHPAKAHKSSEWD